MLTPRTHTPSPLKHRYTTAALRRLWDTAHATTRHHAPALLGMLQGKFRLDAPSLLRASDRLLFSLHRNRPTATSHHHLGPDPTALGLVEAATGWPLPALHPPRVLPSALASRDGPFRPAPLPPVDVEGLAARRLQGVFARALETDPEETRKRNKKERRKKAGQQEAAGGGGGGGESGDVAAAVAAATTTEKGKRKRA